MTGGPSDADDAVDAADPSGSGGEPVSGEFREGAGEISAGARARKPRTRRTLIVLLVGVPVMLVALVESGALLSNWIYPTCLAPMVSTGGGGGTSQGESGSGFSSYGSSPCDIPPRRGPLTAAIIEGYGRGYEALGGDTAWDVWTTPIYTANLNIGEDVCFVHPVRSDWDVHFEGETPEGEPVTIEHLHNEAADRCEYSGNPDSKNLWAYYLAEGGEVQSGDTVRVWMNNGSRRSVFAEISIR